MLLTQSSSIIGQMEWNIVKSVETEGSPEKCERRSILGFMAINT